MEEVAAVPTEVEPEPVAVVTKAAPAKKAGKKGKSTESAVALLDPPSVESAEVAVAEEAVAQGLAVVRPPDPEVAEPALRSLGLQAEIDSLRAQQADWELARKAWDQERAQLISEREMVEQFRRSWDEERAQLVSERDLAEQQRKSENEERARLVAERDLEEQLRESWNDERTALQDKAAELELELELTQKQMADFQASNLDLQTRLTAAEQDAADELKQITSLQDEMAETSRRLESRENEMEQWSRRLGELQAMLDEVRETESNLRMEMEELELLKEDLEETIVERRRELKALRISEAEARAYAEECKLFRESAEAEIQAAQGELVSLRQSHQDEVKVLGERLASSLLREEELKALATEAKNNVNQDALRDAERRHLEAEKRLIEVNAELDSLRRDGSDRERLERRCLLLENDLKAANQELMTLERSQSRLETEKQQLAEEMEKLKVAGTGSAGAPASDEAEIRQWKLRADDLRESLRKQRTENERLQERVDVLIKAKELEEKQRKEVESRLRTALRIQARQQGGF